MKKLSIKICMLLFLFSIGQKTFAGTCYRYVAGDPVHVAGVAYCYCGVGYGCWCTFQEECPCE